MTGRLRAGFLAALLLSGCVPTRWPEQPAPAPAPLPPVTARTPAPPAAPRAPAPAPRPMPGEELAEPLPRARSGNPLFYDVLGQRYYVLEDSEGYREQGIASWYGGEFHGKRTSSGTVYDMHDYTAAHRTLPLPTLVRVTNLDNGRSVLVTVDDRGPFVKNRLIDLSFAAAKDLDIVRTGTGRVEVEAVRTRPVTTTAATDPGLDHYLQVGAFREEANAQRLKQDLESKGVGNVVIRYDEAVRPAVYRVRIGPIQGTAEYDALASRLAALSIANPRLVTESRARPAAPATTAD